MRGIFTLAVLGASLSIFARDASEFGFSPSASGTENRAALQRAFDVGGRVTVNEPGDYKIADTVFIGGNTVFECAPGVRLVSQRGSDPCDTVDVIRSN